MCLKAAIKSRVQFIIRVICYVKLQDAVPALGAGLGFLNDVLSWVATWKICEDSSAVFLSAVFVIGNTWELANGAHGTLELKR